MEDNNNLDKEIKKEICKCTDYENWVKFACVCFAVFLGSFFAFYFVADQTIKHSYIYPRKEFRKMERMERMMERGKREFGEHERALMREIRGEVPPAASPFAKSPFLRPAFPVPEIGGLKFEQNQKGYAVTVDLEDFGKNPENVKLDIKPNKINISYSMEKNTQNQEISKSFSQTFMVDKKIDTKRVTKKVDGDELVIFMPYETK